MPTSSPHTPAASWPSANRCSNPRPSTSSRWPTARHRSTPRQAAEMADDARLVGDRIAYHRKRLGLSQVEFAGLVGRSESWVSQVERGVRPVDRMSVLRKVAEVLNVPVSELRGQEDSQPEAAERPEAFDLIRSALTGHPALAFLLGDHRKASADLAPLTSQHAQTRDLAHASRYTDLPPILAALIPGLAPAILTASTALTRHWT